MARALLEANLDESIESLRAIDLRDLDRVWQKIGPVLDQLHQLEEWIRKNDPSYYATRDASDEGRVAAALMYIRGPIHHAGQPWRYTAWRKNKAVRDENGKWREVPVSGRTYILLPGWPPRDKLPAPDSRAKAHGRDIYYDQLVAGRPLLMPIDIARAFLGDRP